MVCLYIQLAFLFTYRVHWAWLPRILSKPVSYFSGDNSYNDVCRFIQKLFESKNRDGNPDRIFVQLTCATDTENMDHVFRSVTETIIEKNLEKITIF